MSKRTSNKASWSVIVFVIVLIVMMIIVAFGPAVSQSKAPAPIKTAAALIGSNNVHAAGQTDSKDECDDDSEECCEDDSAPNSEEHPKCTSTPVPQPSIAPSNTPVPTATSVNTPTPRSTPKVVPTNSPTRTPTATNTATQVPLPTMPATATPTNNPTSTPVNTPTPTRTPVPTNKPTSTPHGMVKTPVPTTVISTPCTCARVEILTWDEEDDGDNWLISRFNYLKSKGFCVQINFDPPANADWIDEVNQTIDSLYK